MLSIDEAIELLRTERMCVRHADVCDRECEKCALVQDTDELLEMYDSVCDWLEELKAIKDGSIPIIHGKAELKLHDKEVYNKAIDDAKSVILQTIDNEILVDTLHLRLEQLKGKYNE